MAKSGKNPDGHAPSPARSTETSELAARIRKAQQARHVATGDDGQASRQGDMTMLARGLRIATEFVAAILVGSGIGYLIDQIAGTTPWALLIMFMVGFAAGVLNVTRVVAEMNAPKPASPEVATDANKEQN
jgi:ATP synthase protein I